jgi:hypothetical protein
VALLFEVTQAEIARRQALMGAVAKANPKKQTKKTEAGKHGQFPPSVVSSNMAGKSPHGGKKAGKIIERNGDPAQQAMFDYQRIPKVTNCMCFLLSRFYKSW